MSSYYKELKEQVRMKGAAEYLILIRMVLSDLASDQSLTQEDRFEFEADSETLDAFLLTTDFRS